MKSTVETLEGNKVKLSVEVEEAEFDSALDAAFRRLAAEVRIPGFRPGKAPRRVLEARLGPLVARDEALRTALPEYYEQAVREHEVEVIAAPDIDITAGQEEGVVTFDAVVEIRPTVELTGYQNLKVTVPSPVPSADDVTEQIDQLRRRFATLETVDRAATDEDHVTIDVTGSQDGEPLEGLTAQDYDYEVGAGAVVPELDENLRGAKAGDILEFDAPHPDAEQPPLHLRVLVKEVQAPVLPEVDDDFAQQASEYETADELRSEIERNLRVVRAARSQMLLTERSAEALAELVDLDIPDALVSNEAQDQLQNLAMRAQAQGLTLEQFLTLTGKAPQDIGDEIRQSAEKSARVDLALRALADAEGIEASEEKLDEEFAAVAERFQRDPAEIRAEFERSGGIVAVRSDLRKRGALEWLLERVEIVDDDGNPLDRSELELPAEDASAEDSPVEDSPAEDSPSDETGDETE